MSEYKHIEARVKKVEGYTVKLQHGASRMVNLEIELEENDSPVRLVNFVGGMPPIEKGDYVKISIDVFLQYGVTPDSGTYCRELLRSECAAIIAKLKNGETVATYHSLEVK